MFQETTAFGGFAVPDIAAAQDFYGNTLGLKTKTFAENQSLMEIELAGGHRIFVYTKPDHEPATFTILNFEVDDIDSAVDGLMARGVETERYEGFDQDDKGIARPDSPTEGPQIAWFKDPAGNILSVLQNG